MPIDLASGNLRNQIEKNNNAQFKDRKHLFRISDQTNANQTRINVYSISKLKSGNCVCYNKMKTGFLTIRHTFLLESVPSVGGAPIGLCSARDVK